MDYSMDFKPRFILGDLTVNDTNSDKILFNFYDYSKHKDIKCYEKDGETPVPDETIEHVLNKYYCGDDKRLTYHIVYIDSKLVNAPVYRCIAEDPNGLIRFIGYSEFSALHAVEDLENAKKLILGRYYHPQTTEE